jgi:hypothetical protein
LADQLADQNGLSQKEAQKQVSLLLNEKGVKGIAYEGEVDGPSVVIFDDRAIKVLETYYQKQDQAKGPRGALEIMANRGLRMIFTEAADASTPIHESGHLFVELIRQVLETPPDLIVDWEAFGRLNDEFRALAEWAGQEDPYGEWSREAHEKVARGLETYLMEGQAPVPRLKGMFEKMKAWLLDIYKAVSGDLDAPLNDDVRQFFDRLLAADWEIVMDGWRTRGPEGLAPEIESELAGPRAEARAAMKAAIRQKRLAEVQKMRKQWKDEGAAEADRNPHQRMVNDIIANGGMNRDSLLLCYDKDTIIALNRKRPGLVSSKSKIGFDEFAEQHGFGGRSDEFIQRLKDGPTKQKLIDDYVAEQESYYAEWLDADAPITEEEINLRLMEEEAVKLKDDVKAAAARVRTMKGELKKNGGFKRFKRIMEEKTGRKSVDDLSQMDMSDSKAALKKEIRELLSEAAQAGYRAGVKSGSFAKYLEMLARHRVNQQAKNDILKTRGQWKRFVKQKPASPTAVREGGIEAEFSIQAKQLLNQLGFDIKEAGRLEIRGAPNLAGFVEEQRQQGNDVYAPEWILKGQWPVNPSGTPKTIGQLSYDQFTDVKDTIDSLLYLGRENQKTLAGGNRQSFDSAAETIIKVLSQKLPLRKDEGPGPKSQARKTTANYLDDLLKGEFVIRDFDGPDAIMGPVWEILFAPTKRAEDAELLLGAKVVEALKAAWSEFTAGDRQAMGTSPGRERLTKLAEKTWLPIPESWRTTRYTFEGAPHSLTRAEMISVYANLGNPENMQNLIEGNGFSLKSLAAVCDALTDREKAAVDAMVAAIDQLYQPLADIHFKATGVVLPKVDPGEITLPNGEKRQGWYFPIARDPEKGQMASQQQQASTAVENLTAMGYGRRSARSGASHQRTGAVGALSLSLDVLNKHIQDTTHDITHRLAVRDIQRLLNRKDVRQAIIDRAGPGRYERLQGWINWVAQPRSPQLEGGWAAMDWVRRNAVTATLAFNVNTPFMQLMGFAQSIDFVGFRGIARGVRDMIFRPLELTRFVRENSPSVAARDQGNDQDVREILRGLDGDAGIMARERKAALTAAFWAIKMLDRAVVYPTWWGAYDKAIREGQTEAYAREYADSAVRLTQPLASPKDTAAVQRDPRMKILAMYYTFFSGFHNRLVERYRGFRHGRLSAKDLASTVLWTIIIPTMLTRLYQQEDLPDEADDFKSLLGDLAAYTVSGMPIVRDVVAAATSSYKYEISPLAQVGRTFSTTIQGWGEVITGEDEADEGLGKSTVRSAGYLFGLPSNQALRTWDGYWKLVEGDTRNPLRLFKPEPKERK